LVPRLYYATLAPVAYHLLSYGSNTAACGVVRTPPGVRTGVLPAAREVMPEDTPRACCASRNNQRATLSGCGAEQRRGRDLATFSPLRPFWPRVGQG